MAIKRLHYFDHQFLVEADFSEEQKYHLDMRRRLNRLLYTFGIAEGLVVVKSASQRVTVRPGVALDRFGREMIVESDQVVDLSNAEAFPAGTTVFITLAYQEQESDPASATGVSGNTRITEQPVVQADTADPPSDGTVVRLARLELDANANVPGNINDPFDGGVRQMIGPRGERGLASLEGVSNPGRNIDLVPANAVTILPNDANNRITIGETHSALTNNPHKTNAAQVGALPASGGTITGNLNVGPNGSTARLGNPDGTAQNGFGMDAGKSQSVLITGQAEVTGESSTRAALFIFPGAPDVQGLFCLASSPGVDTMTVGGTARFSGTKIGYVADTFVNGSGTVLRTGDIVKLKSSGIVRFHGDNNRIPIPEVTLADSENDPLVIGIVAQEATPAADEPDRRPEPDDPTTIPDGGELFVVTLGTFAHCRVDATVAPIEVGDLLTSSANPGHAKKATEPKIGAIIGKALEPLREGTNYIAVFVNIQ